MQLCIYKKRKAVSFMQISLSDLKADVEKYVDLSETEDIVIKKNGIPVAKIICFDKKTQYVKAIPEKITSVEQLFGTLPRDADLDNLKNESLLK